MKEFVSVILMLLGVILGLYVGIKIMCIDGILQIAKSLNPVNTIEIAWGIIRIIFSGAVGWLTFIVFLILANSMR